MQIKKQTNKNKEKHSKLQKTPPTNDFDDSPYPNDTLKFRCIIVKWCESCPEKLLEKKSQGVSVTPSPFEGQGLRKMSAILVILPLPKCKPSYSVEYKEPNKGKVEHLTGWSKLSRE